MDFLKRIKQLYSQGIFFQNVLVYNVDIYILDILKESSRYVKHITFAFNNNFTISSLSGKLRFFKNISFINSNIFENSNVVNFDYDLVIIGECSNKFLKLILKNDVVQYVFTKNEKLSGIFFDNCGDHIYKRNYKKIMININDEYEKHQKNTIKNKNIEYEYKKYQSETIKSKNIDDDVLDNVILNNKENINNNTINSNIIDQLFLSINVSNLVPNEIVYDKHSYEKVIDGVIALSIIINDENDFKKFLRCKELVLSQYNNIKYYIILNGVQSLQFSKNFNDVEFLIKSKDEIDTNYCYKILNDVIKNEYHYNLNILNEDELENIWNLT